MALLLDVVLVYDGGDTSQASCKKAEDDRFRNASGILYIYE